MLNGFIASTVDTKRSHFSSQSALAKSMWNKEALHLFCSLQVRCKFSKCFKISLHSSRRSHWYASRALHSILQHFETKTSRAALYYLTRRQLWAPSLFESFWIVSYLCVCVFLRERKRDWSVLKSPVKYLLNVYCAMIVPWSPATPCLWCCFDPDPVIFTSILHKNLWNFCSLLSAQQLTMAALSMEISHFNKAALLPVQLMLTGAKAWCHTNLNPLLRYELTRMDEVHYVTSLQHWQLPVDQTSLGRRCWVPQERGVERLILSETSSTFVGCVPLVCWGVGTTALCTTPCGTYGQFGASRWLQTGATDGLVSWSVRKTRNPWWVCLINITLLPLTCSAAC